MNTMYPKYTATVSSPANTTNFYPHDVS